MLDALRQAATGWVAKVLLALLVISFAIWGISGQFFDYGAGTVATVGDAEVSAREFDRTLRDRMQAIGQQTRGFSLEQARAIGIPQQVLGELVSRAALDDEAARYGLGVSDAALAGEIQAEPAFQGIAGFDRARFQALLRNAGLREDDYVRDLRNQILRRQLVAAVTNGLAAPQPLVEALYRFQNEERAISYLRVDAGAVPAPGEPDATALAAYFEASKNRFRAPEYRKIGTITLDAAALADPATISEEAVAETYEARQGDFSRPERRRVEQIRFEDRAAAEAAWKELQGGTDFAALAASRNLTAADIDLGLKSKAEFVDAAIAEAAFAAKAGKTLLVLDSPLGAAIIRVAEVEAGETKPIEAVAAQLRRDLAQAAAEERILDFYDRVEDERAGGATLQEVAAKLSLPYRLIDGVAADGTAPDGGKIADLPGGQDLVAAAFRTDVGVETDPIRTEDEGYVFYEVLEIVPERDRTLEEARQQVVDTWKRDELARRVAARAEELFQRLKAGESLETLAQATGGTVGKAEAVRRNQAVEGLSRNAVAQAFAGPQGHVANAEAEPPPARLLLRVDQVTAPAYFAESESAAAIRERLTQSLQDDVLQAYNGHVLQTRRTTINRKVYSQIAGEDRTQ